MKTLAKYPGVYIVVNIINNKKYVGSTLRAISFRFAEHRWSLRYSRHRNIELQDDWNKYGEKAFAFIPLENITDKENILKRECYWYEKYLSLGGVLYNQVHPKDNGHTSPHKKKTIEKIKASHQIRYRNMTDKEKYNLVKPIREYWDERSPEMLGQAVKQGWYKKNEKNKPVTLISPDGIVYKVKHKRRFAINHGLDPSALTKVIKGVRKSHKGWSCKHI